MVELYITLFLATLANVCAGLLISALVRSQSTVIYVILIMLFIQILFAGAIFDLPGPAKPISYLTTTRWTLEALGDTIDLPTLADSSVSCIEFESQVFRRSFDAAKPPCRDGQMKQKPDFKFTVGYRYDVGHLISRWIVLTTFAVVFGGLTWILQKKKDVI
jgi:hypothetical protein